MCDRWRRGVKNCPNLHYIIIECPLRPVLRLWLKTGVPIPILQHGKRKARGMGIKVANCDHFWIILGSFLKLKV